MINLSDSFSSLTMENGQNVLGKDTSLKRFKLKGVEFISEDLDNGCFYYAKVSEVTHAALTCTAKQVDHKLLDLDEGTQKGTLTENVDAGGEVHERYASYCSMLSSLCHPHIVQFLGISYKPESLASIWIVTERLPASLESVLKRFGHFPEEMSYSILRDVSLGLAYLHGANPSVGHGELAACNVLLSWDMTAKLSDVWISNLLHLSPDRRKGMGRCTIAHLPPETLLSPGRHASQTQENRRSLTVQTKVDSYSYGALIVHVLSGKYPEYLALKASRVRTYSTSTDTDMDMNGVDEILGGVSPDHPLSSLALQCLSRTPEVRPTASQIVSTVSGMMLQFPIPSFERRVELLQKVFKTTHSRKASHERSRSSVERKDSIVTLSNSLEIEHLKLQIDELHVENRGLRTSIKRQQSIINARDHEMAAKLMAKDQEIISNQEELAAFEATVASYGATISAKEATVHGLTNQLKHLQEYIANKHEVRRITVLYTLYARTDRMPRLGIPTQYNFIAVVDVHNTNHI